MCLLTICWLCVHSPPHCKVPGDKRSSIGRSCGGGGGLGQHLLHTRQEAWVAGQCGRRLVLAVSRVNTRVSGMLEPSFSVRSRGGCRLREICVRDLPAVARQASLCSSPPACELQCARGLVLTERWAHAADLRDLHAEP